MQSHVLKAFRQVADGFSPDRIVADPELNSKFIDACRNLGITEYPSIINLSLLNARKASRLVEYKTTRRTTFSDEDEYRHGSEIAARHLERREGLTLDRVICDPVLANEFDEIAATIAPGFTSLQYRWAALGLRKKKVLKPERVGRVVTPDAIQLGRIVDVSIEDIPRSQGIYIFYSPQETLYVGETENLQKRIGKHLDHSDNKGLARWFWEHGTTDVSLEMMVLSTSTKSLARRAIESELIESRRPTFNVQR